MGVKRDAGATALAQEILALERRAGIAEDEMTAATDRALAGMFALADAASEGLASAEARLAVAAHNLRSDAYDEDDGVYAATLRLVEAALLDIKALLRRQAA